MITKFKLNKLKFSISTSSFVPQQCKLHQISLLNMNAIDIYHLEKLPFIHKDPFDRMLVCQALANKLTILTPDKSITQYKVPTLW